MTAGGWCAELLLLFPTVTEGTVATSLTVGGGAEFVERGLFSKTGGAAPAPSSCVAVVGC